MNRLATTSPGPEQAGPEQDPGTIVKIPGRCDAGSDTETIEIVGATARCTAAPERWVDASLQDNLGAALCGRCVHIDFLS